MRQEKCQHDHKNIKPGEQGLLLVVEQRLYNLLRQSVRPKQLDSKDILYLVLFSVLKFLADPAENWITLSYGIVIK